MTDGDFRRELEAAGVAIGEYDPELQFYRGVATASVIDRITALDFVLYVELIGLAPRRTIRACRSWTRT